MKTVQTILLLIITVLLAVYIVPQTKLYQDWRREQPRQETAEGREKNTKPESNESLEARAATAGYCGSGGCTDPDTGRRIIKNRVLTPTEDATYGRCEMDLYEQIVIQQNRALSEYREAVYECARRSISWI